MDVARDWRMLRAPLRADFSRPGADVSAWESVTLTDPWRQHLAPGYEGALWYFRTLVLPARTAMAEPALLLGPSRHGSYRVWADGVPIGEVGSLARALPFPQPRLFILPGRAVADGTVAVAIRFHRIGWASDRAGSGAGAFQEAVVGPRANLQSRAELSRLRGRMADLAPFVLGLVFAGMGVYHLLLYVRRGRMRAYLWFGLGAVAFGANTLLPTGWVGGPLDHWALSHRLAAVAAHAALVMLVLFLWAVLDRALARWLRAYLLVHAGFVLFLLVAPAQWVLATGPVRMAAMVPAVVAAARVLWRALRAGHPAAAPLVVGAVALVLAGAGELARLYGAPLPGWLPVAGFSALVLSMGLALGETFSRRHRELALARRDLERRLEQRTEALTEVTRAAERAHRARHAFLASMSHELRTPLNSVIGFANLLIRRGAERDEGNRDFLARIRAAGEQLLEVIDDVLDLSRLEAGTLELALADTDVGEIVRGAVARLEAAAADRGVALRAAAPPALRPVRLDPARLEQVLAALVGEAIRLAENGAVTVRVEADGDRPRALVVEGTGAEPSRQEDRGSGPTPPATELALAIARALCRRMGCELSVEGARGDGFRVSLPAVPARPASTTLPFPVAVGPPEGRLVLVIDDEADARLLLAEHVRSFGMRVVSAASGLEGLRLARELAPDLVTLDLKMPGMDGWATLRAFKTDPELRDVPVVVVSVVATEARGTFLGHLDMVGKPVDRDALEQAVRRNLRGGGGRALVVDDDPDSRLLLTTLLESAVEEVRTAEDGLEAVQILEDFTPDVILLDLVMPRMDGIAFLRALRDDPRHARTPVLVVTSKELTAAEATLLERATEGVLRKGTRGTAETPLRDRLSAFLEGSALRN